MFRGALLSWSPDPPFIDMKYVNVSNILIIIKLEEYIFVSF